MFMRGLTRERRHWGEFPEVFRRAVPDAEVVTPDLPGNGRLYLAASPSSVAAMAEQCRDQLLAEGRRPPYYLLAMSLGAMAAVAWAERHPQEVAGCVLISTSLRPFSPFYHRLRPGSYAALARLALPGVGATAHEATVLRLTSRLAGQRDRIVQAWSAWRQEQPVSTANALRQLWAASRYRAPLRRPAVPLLVLAGAGDELVAPRCSRDLAAAWQTDFAEHPAAGHDIPLDDGGWVARQVAAWLARGAGAPASE